MVGDGPLWARLAEFQPDVVGFSVITPGYPVASQQIRRLHGERPDLPIIAGGIHASLFPDDFLADGANAVVVGDGCEPMALLVDRIRRGLPWDDIPGLIGRRREAGPSAMNRRGGRLMPIRVSSTATCTICLSTPTTRCWPRWAVRTAAPSVATSRAGSCSKA